VVTVAAMAATLSPIGDVTTTALKMALDGLERRQAATADNIANLETPGFQSRVVDFEDSLRAAITAGDPRRMDVSVTRSMAPTRLNGNNVNVDMEMVESTETQLRQDLVIAALNAEYGLLRTAITGRA
jgi:flagellar basal-body rod protein FlgB